MWRLWLACLGIFLSGCAGVEVRHYAAQQPVLHLEQYFNGRVEAWGMFQKRSGEVVKRFHVTIEGRMEGRVLILDERFVYSDGTRQQRVWRLTPKGPGRWSGTAGDVIGEAEGQVAGNALRWRYTLKLEVDGAFYPVQFDDWMYLIDDEVLLNRSQMRKFGIRLGEVFIAFRRGA